MRFGTLKYVLSLWLLLPSTYILAQKSDTRDSIVIESGEKTKILIYGSDRKEIEKILNYDLDRLISDMSKSIPSKGAPEYMYEKRVPGKNYLKDPAAADSSDASSTLEVRSMRDMAGSIRIQITIKNSPPDSKSPETAEQKPDLPKIETKQHFSPRKGFQLKLGLNTYGSNVKQEYDTEDYDLRTGGSRYISLGVVHSARIINGKRAGLHLDYGLDFSWFNLMFDGNNTVTKDPATGKVAFSMLTDANGNEIALSKSKLTLPYLNVSLMPTLTLKNIIIAHVSAGAYAGYRLGGYTKTKTAADKEKNRVHGNYFAQDFRYGLSFEIGLRHLPDFFLDYDLGTLFEEARGPRINMLSVGIRL